jgi:hypothetical protein
VQQVENVSTYGEKLAAKSVVLDATGALVANVTHSCDAWMLGTDPQGVVVVIQRDQGKVIAHGNMHKGEALSGVTSPVPLPVRVTRGQ